MKRLIPKCTFTIFLLFLLFAQNVNGQVSKKMKEQVLSKSYYVANNLFSNPRYQAMLLDKAPKNERNGFILFMNQYKNCETYSVSKFDSFSTLEEDNTRFYYVGFSNNMSCGDQVLMAVHKINDNKIEYFNTRIFDKKKQYKKTKKELLTKE